MRAYASAQPKSNHPTEARRFSQPGRYLGLEPGGVVKRAAPFALALAIWITPVPAGLTATAWHLSLLFASSYFSTITPQGGSQNVIFVGSGYLTQGELYRAGALVTGVCLLIFLLLGTPWLLLVAR